MHHENILGRDGAIGLQLETPVAVWVLQAEQGAGGMLNGVLQLRQVQTVWSPDLAFLDCLVIRAEYGAVPHGVRPSSELNAPDSLYRRLYFVMASLSGEPLMVMAVRRDRKEASGQYRFVAPAVSLRWFP
jgi:hypothetical protein